MEDTPVRVCYHLLSVRLLTSGPYHYDHNLIIQLLLSQPSVFISIAQPNYKHIWSNRALSVPLISRLLHSLCLVVVELSLGSAIDLCYIAWVIRWSQYELRETSPAMDSGQAVMHFGTTWPVGISADIQSPLRVPLHSPNGRQSLLLGLCKETVKESNLALLARLSPADLGAR